MNVITIPRQFAQKDDLVVIPRREYEGLLAFRKATLVVKPTKEELRAIRRGEKEIARGDYISLSELKNELAHRRN